MLITDTQSRTVYPLAAGDNIALTSGPADLNLGDHDRQLTTTETSQLDVLLWLTPTQAVLLAQQLFDAATERLSVEQIELIRTQLRPNEKESTMTEPAVTPSHRDRALALRTTLAWLRGDYDLLPMLAAEAETPQDVDQFIVALLDSFTRVLTKRLEDPVGYLESWIAVEQGLAEHENNGPDGVS